MDGEAMMPTPMLCDWESRLSDDLWARFDASTAVLTVSKRNEAGEVVQRVDLTVDEQGELLGFLRATFAVEIARGNVVSATLRPGEVP